MKLKFIDLFAGLGGIRIGFEQACSSAGVEFECMLTSEIKPYAIKALKRNFDHNLLIGDITEVKTSDIPDFDILLGGFPCQAFSSAGKGHGFLDTRGTLFFEVERILRDKRPFGFILENVEGLVHHDREHSGDKIGRTLETILQSLSNLGYYVTWALLDSQNFGVPQARKRVYIVGTKISQVNLDNFTPYTKKLSEVLESSSNNIDKKFTEILLRSYSRSELFGMSIKDKRGGKNNIHSWDLGLKGEVSFEQKELLEKLLKERRKKHWAEKIGIDWMDGMPLTESQISTFFEHPNLNNILESLVRMGYLVFEHPKAKIRIDVGDGKFKTERIYDTSKPKGYNIVSGKLSFQYSKILNPTSVAPTLVAMDMNTLGVLDRDGIRNLSIKEGLAIFGFPESYSLDFLDTDLKLRSLAFDLLGNTVSVPVINAVSSRLIELIVDNNI